MAINGERNRLSAPACPPGGADNILYGGGIWRLDHDEVLLVECDVPDAKIWNFTIHTYPWFESGDHESRPSSLNHRTTHIDDDGIMRIVIAHSDPGSANWIDTENRTESLLTYRWIQTRNAPHPQARVLKASELRNELPNEHPAVSNAERQRRQSAASELLRERYR
jgi:hypothetical protein